MVDAATTANCIHCGTENDYYAWSCKKCGEEPLGEGFFDSDPPMDIPLSYSPEELLAELEKDEPFKNE